MADLLIETRTFEQLPRATAVSPDAVMAVQEEGAPAVGIALKYLLRRLTQADLAKETYFEVAGDLDHDESSIALVYADPDPAKNGWYRKVGASGGGNWTLFEKLTRDVDDQVEAAVNAALAAQAYTNYRATLAEAIADFAVGTYFTTAETGELRIYKRIAGAPFYEAQPDAATLASKAALERLGSVIGYSANAPNVVQFGEHNYLHPGAAACAVAAGTVDQPNINGGKGYIQTFDGDGVTAFHDVTPGFVVANAPYRNLLVVRQVPGTRAQAIQTEGADYTVTGKGTGTVRITPTAPIPAGEQLFIRAYSKSASAPASILLNFISEAYDCFNDATGPMNRTSGAHHIMINNPGGHNTIDGGSSILIRDNSSYCNAWGLSHDIYGATAASVGGRGNRATGFTPTVFGAGCMANGWAVAIGEGSEAPDLYAAAIGRRVRSRIGGDFATGNGQAADARPGMVTSHKYTLRRAAPLSSSQTMIPATGTAVFIQPDNSLANVEVKGTIIAPDGTFRDVRLKFSCWRGVGAASTTLVGGFTNTATQLSEFDKTPALSPTAGQWEMQGFASAGSGGFSISVRGNGVDALLGDCEVRVRLREVAAAPV